MNVRNQSIQAFVTSLGPFCNRSWKYKHFRTIWKHYWWQFSHGFEFFFCGVVVINAWSWHFVELLSRLVLSTHKLVPHISWHDLPCQKTTKRFANFPSMIIFQLLPRKSLVQTWFSNCPQHLCLFHIVFWVHSKYTWSEKNVGQPILCHPHTHIRITIFHGVRISIPN